MSLNIFSSLARYADRQTENFLTESFVYLLNLLLEREKTDTVNFLQKLCGENSNTWFTPSSDISVIPQFSTETGRPDILIEIDDTKIVFIEVKHDSPLGWKQLERYTEQLNRFQNKERQLVLLSRSRHSIQQTTLSEEDFHHVCWYEISDWLSKFTGTDQICKYIMQQFIDFLLRKEMSMEKVNWEYMEGVPAMIRLANMLHIAISEALPEMKWKRTAGWSWMGYYVGGSPPLFIGFRYQNPLTIVFENNSGNNATFITDLSLSDVHFFSLSAGEQLECLIQFIKESQVEYLSKYPNATLAEEPESSPLAPETQIDESQP